jgi:hypothetical protein
VNLQFSSSDLTWRKGNVFRTVAGAVALVAAVAQFARAAEPLVLEKNIPLTGVEGRIDHMAADGEWGTAVCRRSRQ